MKSFIRPLLLLLLLLRSAHGEPEQTLNSNDVARVLSQALTRAAFFVTNRTTTNAVIAVVNREGFVLGVLSLQAPGVTVAGLTEDLAVVNAISKAGTAAFLSSDQNAFTSRTAGYIVQQHFPPLINNVAPGPLVGVNLSSLAFSDINRFKDPDSYQTNVYGGGGTNGAPIATAPVLQPLTGLNGSPGGVPLYKKGKLVGGVGAAIRGKGRIPELTDIQLTTGETYFVDEDVALAGQIGYQPPADIIASQVLIGGIRLPYVNSTTRLSKAEPIGSTFGEVVTNYPITDSPLVSYPRASLGGVEGEIRAPIIDDPLNGGLTSTDVSNILGLAAKNAADIRAGIRQPTGTSAKVFIAVVNNPGHDNGPPTVLGTFRILDATMFSWDVAVQKARTALYFSTTKSAYSSRAVGFLAQTTYPPGINETLAGPFLGLQEVFSLLQTGVTNPLNGIYFETNKIPPARFTSVESITNFPLQAPFPSLPNGITIFPGGFPLYKDGKMVGAVGVSGDGVDVDDLIAAWGTVGFEAPTAIRSDQIIFRGTRLPYAKFPRNPTL